MIRFEEELSMLASTDQRDPNGRPAEPGRKPYRKPRIEDYGSITELTGTGTGTVEDTGGTFDFSGAAA